MASQEKDLGTQPSVQLGWVPHGQGCPTRVFVETCLRVPCSVVRHMIFLFLCPSVSSVAARSLSLRLSRLFCMLLPPLPPPSGQCGLPGCRLTLPPPASLRPQALPLQAGRHLPALLQHGAGLPADVQHGVLAAAPAPAPHHLLPPGLQPQEALQVL